jgi:glycerol-3-phosphate acyltransferase PlsY
LIAIVGKRLLPGEQVPWLGLALIAGNRLPCFHGFRGGKGVANTLGFTLGYAPLWATASALAWLTARTFVSTSFITSFVMLGILTTGMIVQGGLSIHATTAASVICLVVAAAHRKNIREFMDSLK